MAEIKEEKKGYSSIKQLSGLLEEDNLPALLKRLDSASVEMKKVLSKIDDKETEINEKIARETEELIKKEEEKIAEESKAIETKVEEKEEKVETEKTLEEVQPVVKEEIKVEEKPVEVEKAVEPEKKEEQKTFTPKSQQFGEQRSFEPRGQRDTRPFDKRPQQNNFGGQQGQRREGFTPRNQGDRPQTGGRPNQFTPSNRPNQNGSFQRPNQNFGGGMGAKSQPAVDIVSKPQGKSAMPQKKKTFEKNYEEKKTLNKRALIKQQISVDDFDEDKSGYRKLRTPKKQKVQESQVIKIEKAVLTSDIVPIKLLSEKIGISAVEITKRLFKENIIKNINDTIDFDTAAFIAADLDIELELKQEKTAEEMLKEFHVDEADGDENLVRRPPVVTVMGHVDHGKTSLLDRIRSANVTAGEAGGITQHIGAYSVSLKGKQITFLDTPGHAAFTAMRARGAMATDIAILVVAADDGVMPQTIEAINHAKAANVPIIVAINKIDKPTADIDRIKQQLAEHNVVPEEWGGDSIMVPVSAKAGLGIDDLLESINVLAEINDLKANPNRKAKGVIIEAKLDKGKGPLATVLVQNGTLKTGDNVVIGLVTGKVRAMMDDKGRTVKEAAPSSAVSIIGLEEVPNAGDALYVVDEKLSKMVAEERKIKQKTDRDNQTTKVSLEDMFSRMSESELKELNLIVKADVQGSVEAVKESLLKLSTSEVRINVIHAQAGAINESDVTLAESSKAIIIGFNIRPDTKAKQLAEQRNIEIKLYRVIYEALDDIEKALKGMLAPKFKETVTGSAEVRNVFKISGVGSVAGSYVIDGKIVRNGKVRLLRNSVIVTEGEILALKRFKDDVKEVATNYECGISIKDYNDIKEGDIIECFVLEQIED